MAVHSWSPRDALGRGAKEQGAFKLARRILRGWEEPEDLDERVRSPVGWEITLQRRPATLFIEVPAGTKLMPEIGRIAGLLVPWD